MSLREQGAETQMNSTEEIAKGDSNQPSQPLINQLPHEVLSLIFLVCDDPQMERNLNLSLVCKTWQRIVVSEPVLWSNITIQRDRDITKLHFLWHQIEMSLVRSKQAPLNILVDLRDTPGYHEYMDKGPRNPVSREEYDDITAATILRLVGNDREHMHRWRSFELHCPESLTRIAVMNVWRVLEGRYETLTQFLISSLQSSLPHIKPSPVLNSCTTEQPTHPGEILVNPSRLTRISFDSYQMATTFLRMAATTIFSALSSLHIWKIDTQEISDAPLHFPRLSTLRLYNALTGQVILPLLAAPHLTNMTFTWWQESGIDFLLPSIFTNLKTLHFYMNQSWNVDGVYRYPREPLRVALSSAPLLRKLKIVAGSMSRENAIDLVGELRAEGYSLEKLTQVTLVNATFIDRKQQTTVDVIDIAVQ
ncbi:hypothetical protein M408DRAFT_23960 [Serendipita vermifera MAFF 305830]|uniref:F-box domain-containing protein n=1 Tax=Serendipita vermifera MAFF 305830 TaxID=933852 RepID=A0A0C2XGK8_SERVB|nr:hypothetical protein M408DRAFT_23960 [Serendipita vermifera MAFF 305830]